MKILAIPLLLLLWSCSNSTENSQNKDLSVSNATISKAEFTDTTADEEFEKFLQRFAKDSSFQISRIKFPIKVISTDEEKEEIKLLNQKDWKFTDYSSRGSKQFYSEKIKNGLINLIFTLEDTGVLVYHYFGKKDGKWMLLSIEDHST